MSNTTNKPKVSEGFNAVKEQMGVRSGGPENNLGINSMGSVLEKAAKSTKRKRGKNAIPGRKRGGQPGNKNAVSGNAKRPGIYASLSAFQERFDHYSKALGKATALEEVALTRAMMMNLLDGKDPLGCGEIEDPEILNAYARDMVMLSIKAQELYMKQEAKRIEQEEKNGAKAGVNIMMSAELMDAMGGMVAAQEAAAALNAEEAAAEVTTTDA